MKKRTIFFFGVWQVPLLFIFRKYTKALLSSGLRLWIVIIAVVNSVIYQQTGIFGVCNYLQYIQSYNSSRRILILIFPNKEISKPMTENSGMCTSLFNYKKFFLLPTLLLLLVFTGYNDFRISIWQVESFFFLLVLALNNDIRLIVFLFLKKELIWNIS